MAFNAGSVQGTLELDVKQFVAALSRANAALDRIENNSRQAAKGVTGFRGALGGLRDAVIVLPALFRALKAPFDLLRSGLKSVVGEFITFEQQIRDFAVAAGQAGVRDVPAFTASFRDFASELQRTTKFSDGMVLEVGKTLSVLGVQEDQLQLATKAVLDYSAATGREAIQSAINFGKSLGGVVGELGEAFPAVKELTVEQLKLGGAFQLAADQMGGFAEASSKTLGGALEKTKNAFDDVKKTLGEELAPVFVEVARIAQESAVRIVDFIKANGTAIREGFATFGAAALEVISGLVLAGVKVAEILLTIGQTANTILPAIAVTWAEIKLQIYEAIDAMNKFLEKLGFTGTEEGMREFQKNLENARNDVEGLTESWNQMKAEQEKSRQSLETFSTLFKDAAASGRDLAARLREGNFEMQKGTQLAAQVETKVKGAAEATKKRLEWLREINGISLAKDALLAKDATEGMADALGRASSQSAQTAQNLGQAAANATQAASASAAVGGGGGGGGGGDFQSIAPGFAGRSSGGAAGLDLSTIQGAQASLDAVKKSINRSVGGPFSKFARRSARGVADAIEAKLKGMTEAAFADFTGGLLSELNRQGVFDPAARQKYIDDRIQEAVRLGVLPSRGRSGGFG